VLVKGYWRITVPADAHDFVLMRPMLRRVGNHWYVLEHRLVMARHLGRPLLDSETVHHVDSVRTNNAISNLKLISSNGHPRAYGYGYASGFLAGAGWALRCPVAKVVGVL